MKKIIFVLVLFLCTFNSIAQQAPAAKDPCRSPIVELYDATNKKLSEGTMPRGKVTLVIKNNPQCDKSLAFAVVKGRVYYVRPKSQPVQVDFEGPQIDFSSIEKTYKPGDEFYFEITDVTYNYNNGEETGKFPGAITKVLSF